MIEIIAFKSIVNDSEMLKIQNDGEMFILLDSRETRPFPCWKFSKEQLLVLKEILEKELE